MTTRPEIYLHLDGKFFDRISSADGNIPYVIADHKGHIHYLQKAEGFKDPVCGDAVNAWYGEQA